MTQGEKGHCMYIVKSGQLSVREGGTVDPKGEVTGGQVLRAMGPGECFGERALLYNEPRSATVQAVMRSELLCLDRKVLQDALGELNPMLLLRNFMLIGLKSS